MGSSVVRAHEMTVRMTRSSNLHCLAIVSLEKAPCSCDIRSGSDQLWSVMSVVFAMWWSVWDHGVVLCGQQGLERGWRPGGLVVVTVEAKACPVLPLDPTGSKHVGGDSRAAER